MPSNSAGMVRQQLLLSIRAPYAKAIFGGTKRAELRRIRPKVVAGDELVVYVPAPICAVVGRLRVSAVMGDAPHRLWGRVGRLSGITRVQFMDYFVGASAGYAILLDSVEQFDQPVSLRQLQRLVPQFRPPQSYHYLTPHRGHDRRLALCLP